MRTNRLRNGLLLCLLWGMMSVHTSAEADEGAGFAGEAPTGTGLVILEPIVITASRIQEPLRDAPLTISVIDGQTLEKSHAVTVENSLRALPGVDVQRQGSIGEQTGVRLRGSLYNQVLVLMDGIEVNSPFDGMFDFGDVLVENIDRIEVVTGPLSPLFGSEAMGGVVQILTERGEGRPYLSLLEEGGSLTTCRTLLSGEERSARRITPSPWEEPTPAVSRRLVGTHSPRIPSQEELIFLPEKATGCPS